VLGDVLSSSRRASEAGASPVVGNALPVHGASEPGLGIDAPAWEVDVSRTAGRNRANGYDLYRNGEVVRSVPPFDRLEVHSISARFRFEGERMQLADLHRGGRTATRPTTERAT